MQRFMVLGCLFRSRCLADTNSKLEKSVKEMNLVVKLVACILEIAGLSHGNNLSLYMGVRLRTSLPSLGPMHKQEPRDH